jgi:hypothetical protein
MIKKREYKGEIGGLFIYKKLLILVLTLFFIFSITLVSANDINTSNNHIQAENASVNYEIQEMEHTSLIPVKKSVSKDFDFFGLFSFTKEKKYGYWLWASDMNKVDLDELSKNGVNVIFLNSYAFTEYGQRDVLNWVKDANDHGIEVHVWMQCFYNGGWISPLKNGTPDVRYFNNKIDEAKYYAGLDGISGIQMDYIRFEGNAYKYENGTSAINQFVQNFSKSVKEINPDLTVSATVMPETNKDAYYYGQDIGEISKHVDVIVPMIYKGNYKEDTGWIEHISNWYVINSGDADVWCGLQIYESDNNLTSLPMDEIMKDKDSVFNGGANGAIFFRWGMSDELDHKKLN